MKKSLMESFLQDLSKFEQIASKILKTLHQSYLRFIIYRSHKSFYDRTVLHNTDFSCCLAHRFVELILLTLFDDFVNLA